jgi:hypothetical protein
LVYRISTGKVLPGMVKMGAALKYWENLTASKVADVTINFSSGRFPTAFFSSPININYGKENPARLFQINVKI